MGATLETNEKMYLQRLFCFQTVIPFLLGSVHFHLQATTWFLTYTSCDRLNVHVPPKFIH